MLDGSVGRDRGVSFIEIVKQQDLETTGKGVIFWNSIVDSKIIDLFKIDDEVKRKTTDYFKIIFRVTGHKTRSIYFHVRKCCFTIWKRTVANFVKKRVLKIFLASKSREHLGARVS